MNQTILRQLALLAIGFVLTTLLPLCTPGAVFVGSDSPAEIFGNQPPVPLLTNAIQVKLLKRNQALQHYPVHIRGVVTCVQPPHSGFVIQDATFGVYVKFSDPLASDLPRVGEECEVDGVSDAGFSPMIRPTHVRRLGTSQMPEPIRPSWDQLMNGSLDTQYTELQGVVTGFQDDGLKLFTRDGVIKVRIPETNHTSLTPYRSALIRLRGCLIARHEDENVSLRFKVGEVDLWNVLIAVLEPAPDDSFSIPRTKVTEMFLYDPQASPFRRVKVAGQIVHEREGSYYLMDGTNGLRFSLQTEFNLKPGDLVEAAGFLRLGGPSPIVSEALVRKTGQAPLPPPNRLAPEELLADEYDSTLVQVDGILLDQRRTLRDEVLGVQAGVIAFEARLAGKPPLRKIPVGSRLRLTGVLAGQGSSRISGGHLASVDLLLNSAEDIQVLARPAWWTAERLFTLSAVLAGVLVLATVWIGLLRREVGRRADQLEKQIHSRERAERQQALEAERARIARDLHDDLGSSMTEISMLAETGRDQSPAPVDARQRFDRILGRARNTVLKLDEIVWAVDPRKDTLPALVGYLSGFAEEYVSATGLTCRIELPSSVPEIPVEARIRHQLFLAVKEALNNAVRHAHASLLRFCVSQSGQELVISIADDGCGFDSTVASGGNGLLNLRARLRSLGGRCEIKSRAGNGTLIVLTLAVTKDSL